MIVDNSESLQRFVDGISTRGDSMGLQINTKETMVTGINRNENQVTNVTVDETPIAQFSKFRYLCSWT